MVKPAPDAGDLLLKLQLPVVKFQLSSESLHQCHALHCSTSEKSTSLYAQKHDTLN